MSGTPSPTLLSPTKLEELFPQVVKGLSPSNIKRTAAGLMDQWEKSLSTPADASTAGVEMKETNQGSV